MGHSRFQTLLHDCIRSLLRGKSEGCTFRPQQRIGNVTHDRKFGFPHCRVQSGKVNGRHFFQISAASAEQTSGFIQKPYTQRCQHSHTAVIGGAAADGNGNFPNPLGKSVDNQLASTVRGGFHGIAFVSRNHGQPGSRRHFNDCTSFQQNSIAGFIQTETGVMHHNGFISPAQLADKGIHCPLSPVCHQDTAGFHAGEYLLRCLFQQGQNLL